ncbi:SRPBCC family protein [Spongiactinospora sp. TRM90649]|uniref:SRPBCC family protein n=1 Tax=Spongiactinospora sp. TRM90649 TaxID=3031114 RepID=UPI0023F6AED5|nr:SRPBCC family protein [Spongiactinospora sp. TRM90649]MDF5755599.1 SRPBCC family protein [Spongiactinospora sp. TRM90649]
MPDVTQQISAVRRTMGTRVLAAGEARVQTISRTFDTDVEDLWDACTNPERLPRWFLPVTGELRLHGRYQFQGNAGGLIERCDPPKGFAATWEYGGEVSWIEVRLTPEPGGRARLELEHVAHVTDEMWKRFGPGATGVGWDLGLLGLSLHMASGHSVTPEWTAEFEASEDYRRFVALSSDLWREADVAAGADPEQAAAAAGRTAAAYTGAE